MKKAILFVPILLALALLVAGCGGGGGSAKLGSGDIAVVGKTHITKSDFDALMVQAKQSFTSQKRAFPKPGTSQYETVKGQAVLLLVQRAELADKAASMGIKVSAKTIQTRLNLIKKQYFGGSEAKYQAQLKQQDLTDQQVRDDIEAQLISEDVFNKVTKNITVSASAVQAYYAAHPQLYSKAETRDVRHILVKTKPLAESLYNQLKTGSNQTWCTLAKKYSKDPSSASQCGKLTVSKGQTVPEFDKVAFSQPTKVVHAPVHNAQYGWFVIEPLSAIHPRSTTPEKQVAATIKQQLLQTKKNTYMTTWVTAAYKSFCSGNQIKYQPGYSSSPDQCASTTTNATTT